LAVALLNFIFVGLLLNDENDFSIFEKSQLDALVVFFLKGFEMIWSIGKTTVELFISLPMIVGELGFGLWLLFKGENSNSNKKTQ